MENLKLKKEWLIQSSNGTLDENYSFDCQKELGQGTYGRVVLAKHKITSVSRAIKIIPKIKVKNHERFKTEIGILKNLDHPNIIKLYETFEDKRNVYLVFEVCSGGELFDRIINQGHFSEEEARQLFRQIMKCLLYCHKHGICHRDLKPENFLFATNEPDSVLKIIDFGLSKVYKLEEEILAEKGLNIQEMKRGRRRRAAPMKTKAGTPYYIAPEVLTGKYDEKCDIWSAGVMLYILLCGYPPFFGHSDPQILESVKKGKFDFSGPEWLKVNQQAKDLITKMLVSSEKRPTAEEVLGHPWLAQDPNQNSELVQTICIEKLNSFVKIKKFKQASLQYIASQMSEKEIGSLIEVFNQLDTNGDGEISFEEFENGLSKMNKKTAEDLHLVFEKLDADKNGSINYTEFIAATMTQSMYLKEEKIYQAFKLFDKDGDGFITPEEIKEVLGKEEFLGDDKKLWEALIQEADTNGDGVVDYNEFITLMSKK